MLSRGRVSTGEFRGRSPPPQACRVQHRSTDAAPHARQAPQARQTPGMFAVKPARRVRVRARRVRGGGRARVRARVRGRARVSVLYLAVLCCGALALAPAAGGASAAGSGLPQPERGTTEYPEWVWPVPPPIRVVAPFIAPADRYSAGHRGIDLAVAPGTEVVAAGAGIVRFAGFVVDRFVVSIEHGAGVVSSIEPVEPSVRVGDPIARGEPIGRFVTGGHCAGGCVHFGVRIDDEYVSPLLFLGGVPRAVLLPLPP